MLDKCNYLGYNKSCNCGFSSSGRASPCQGEGSEFESRNPLHIIENTQLCFLLILWHHSQEVRQRSATPLSPVQVWVVPPQNPSL